jgi:hypothetical protein
MIEASRVNHRWWHDDHLGWASDSPWSLRNPKVMNSSQYFHQIKDFFSALYDNRSA